jgi:hypothetical protein
VLLDRAAETFRDPDAAMLIIDKANHMPTNDMEKSFFYHPKFIVKF